MKILLQKWKSNIKKIWNKYKRKVDKRNLLLKIDKELNRHKNGFLLSTIVDILNEQYYWELMKELANERLIKIDKAVITFDQITKTQQITIAPNTIVLSITVEGEGLVAKSFLQKYGFKIVSKIMGAAIS